jgi:hypothetical protein
LHPISPHPTECVARQLHCLALVLTFHGHVFYCPSQTISRHSPQTTKFKGSNPQSVAWLCYCNGTRTSTCKRTPLAHATCKHTLLAHAELRESSNSCSRGEAYGLSYASLDQGRSRQRAASLLHSREKGPVRAIQLAHLHQA